MYDTSEPVTTAGPLISSATWSALAALATLGTLAFAVWRYRRRQCLHYSVAIAPLVHPLEGQQLEVRRRGAALTDPWLVELCLINPRRRDIPSNAFDRQQPILVEVGAGIVEVVAVSTVPGTAQPPNTKVDGVRLEIEPGRIGGGTRTTYRLLVDGQPGREPVFTHSLLDVVVKKVHVRWPWAMGTAGVRRRSLSPSRR